MEHSRYEEFNQMTRAPRHTAARGTDTIVVPPQVRRVSWRIDVSDAVPLPGRFEIALDVIAPAQLAEQGANGRRPIILSCLPGGFLSRKYFDLEIEGNRTYSFAQAMAERGFIVLAFDHLGVGESSRPASIEDGYALGVEVIAQANQRALEGALLRLADGVPALGLPKGLTPITIGVGHSMGSMLTVEQQAASRAFKGLVLFSFSTRGTPSFMDDAMRAYANDPGRLRREIGELARRTMGTPYPERATNSQGNRRAAFGVGTAPGEAEDALHAAATNLLAVGGLLSMVPGGYAPSAQKIDVPVFMLVGDHDLHDDRHTKADLPLSPSVTTTILDDCWHCHFVANTREILWETVTEWIRESIAET